MSDIRELSNNPYKNYPDFNKSDIDYMFVAESRLDISLAKNWIHKAAAESITKKPLKRNICEIAQLRRLGSIFHNFNKLNNSNIFLENGNLLDKENIKTPNPPDCDAIIRRGRLSVVFTLKATCGQGGSQNHQMNDVERFLNNSPFIYDNPDVIAVAYCCGDFWTGKHRKIKNYSIKKGDKKSRIDVLREGYKDRACIIIGDNDLPAAKVDFLDYYSNIL